MADKIDHGEWPKSNDIDYGEWGKITGEIDWEKVPSPTGNEATIKLYTEQIKATMLYPSNQVPNPAQFTYYTSTNTAPNWSGNTLSIPQNHLVAKPPSPHTIGPEQFQQLKTAWGILAISGLGPYATTIDLYLKSDFKIRSVVVAYDVRGSCEVNPYIWEPLNIMYGILNSHQPYKIFTM